MIKPETFAFLRNLAANNHREWFIEHKEEYELARQNALDFTGRVITELAKADKTIPPDLDPKSCVMRIYRDVRFSKDKTPYKINIGIGISGNGKNFHGAGYYLHIEPGKSFVAGGAWMPETEHLKAIRQEIDYNGSALRAILNAPDFVKIFGKLSDEDTLKTTPKGYDADHPDIDLIKLKSFVASAPISDAELSRPTASNRIVEMFGSLQPLTVFLRNAIA